MRGTNTTANKTKKKNCSWTNGDRFHSYQFTKCNIFRQKAILLILFAFALGCYGNAMPAMADRPMTIRRKPREGIEKHNRNGLNYDLEIYLRFFWMSMFMIRFGYSIRLLLLFFFWMKMAYYNFSMNNLIFVSIVCNHSQLIRREFWICLESFYLKICT